MKNITLTKANMPSGHLSDRVMKNRFPKPTKTSQDSQRFGISISRQSSSRFEEIDTKSWHLTERLAKDHDRAFNNQKKRSVNYVLNQLGTKGLLNMGDDELSKVKSKFELHKDKRIRDFQSNIPILPNHKCTVTKQHSERLFDTSPKHSSILTVKTGESFYFKAAAAPLSDHLPNEFKTYQKSIKQLDLSNKRKNSLRENLIFHSANVFQGL